MDPGPTSGDFTLVSSDGERLTIPAHHFLASSEVFSAAEFMSKGDDIIEFTDDEIETADVLRIFRSLLIDSKLDPAFQPSPDIRRAQECLDLLIPLVRFLQKYDATAVLNVALASICKLTASGKLAPYCCLIAGAVANDCDTCVVAMQQPNLKFPGATPSDPILGTCIPYRDWTKISPRFAWALAHSWHFVTATYSTGQFIALCGQGDNPPSPSPSYQTAHCYGAPRHPPISSTFQPYYWPLSSTLQTSGHGTSEDYAAVAGQDAHYH